MKYYFAYGSNLNLVEMKNRCKDSIYLASTFLYDYELIFNKFLTIIPSKNSKVPIGIFKISENDELNLDIYEEYPSLYKKEIIKLNFNKEIIEGLIYIMNDFNKLEKPSKSYFNRCLDGYKNLNFDKIYLLDALKKCN